MIRASMDSSGGRFIIDAHFHLWRYDSGEYGWISEDMAVLRRDYLPASLLEEFHANGVRGGIVVQARQTLAETEWLIELRRGAPEILGVVGWVDLCSPSVRDDLARFEGELVGVRHILQAEKDDAFMLRESFVRGLTVLSERGLAYDLLIFPRHLANAEALVSRLPDLRFVVDHLAKPFIRDRQIEPWASALRRLARFPNVSCKLSGLVTEADFRAFTREDLRPYLEIALDAFGPERLLFGSDWPVCLVAASYSTVAAVVQGFIERLAPTERAAVLGGNAARWYGLASELTVQ
jgi:L-fuconolactonase